MSAVVTQADESAADLLFNRETSPTLHARAKGVLASHRSEAVEELVEVLAGMLPTNVCLTNTNVPDHWAVPLETTMGELRKIAALVAKHRGEQG